MKLAVDVVLLPPEKIMDFAISINKKFNNKNNEIILSKKDCLPHISLNMGVAEEADIEKIKNQLENLELKPLRLEIVEMRSSIHKSGRTCLTLAVKHSPELQKLHEEVMHRLKGLVIHGYAGDDVTLLESKENYPVTKEWVKNYGIRDAYEHFYPHITIGFDELIEVKLPVTFTASTLALCHLGNYCTCRKVLWKKTLT